MYRFSFPSLKIVFLSAMVAFMGFSCGTKNGVMVEKPEVLIPKNDLVKLLTEAYIVEAVVYFKAQKGIDVGLYTTAYYNALFKKHGVTKNQFSASLKYYIETEPNASSIFLEVVNRLMAKQKTTATIANSEPPSPN